MKSSSDYRKVMFLITILLAIFVVPGSISGTAIALPFIARDTEASLTQLQWVVNAFNLTFACLTLAWGALADGLGRKRCFLAGVTIYSLASLVSGMASTVLLLDMARAFAGVGAAAVFSCGIALLSTHFDGPARIRVFAFFGTVAGLGVSLGPTIAGLLLDGLGWRAIFYSHAMILLAVLLVGKIIPPDQMPEKSKFTFDTVGALLFIAALFMLMMGIVQSSQWGWQDYRTIIFLIVSIILLVIFTWRERICFSPMLDLVLLVNRRFVGYSLVTVAGSFSFVTLLTYFPTYVNSVLDLGATHAGLTMLLLTSPMLVCPILAGKLVARGISSSHVLVGSLACLLGGVAGLIFICQPGAQVFWLAIPLLLVGTGFGLAAGLVDGLALQVVPEQKAGMAAGLLNTFRLGSEAIAVSLYGSTLAARIYHDLQSKLSGLVPGESAARQWINDIAAGNFAIPASVLNGQAAPHITDLLVYGYDHAFHDVLGLLFTVTLMLTVLISFMIRNSRKA